MSSGVNIRGYVLQVYQDPEDKSWVAEAPDLPGTVAAADSPADAICEIEDAIEAWIEQPAKTEGQCRLRDPRLRITAADLC